MPSSMDTKRFNALEEITRCVEDDLLKWPLCCQNCVSYDQQRYFYSWLIALADCHPINLTNYPLRYQGSVSMSPFIKSNVYKWKYLIEFNLN